VDESKAAISAVATRLSNLAGLLWQTNRPSEAEPLYRRALAIDEKSYGPDHPSTKRVRESLRRLQDRAARPSEGPSGAQPEVRK